MSTNMSKREKEVIKEEPKETGINTYEDFQQAVMEIHQNIDQYENPILEIGEKLFGAIAKGKQIDSMTYGDPGIRLFKVGTKQRILDEEKMPADKFRDLEIRRKNEAANR
jgi:hypothetical protein